MRYLPVVLLTAIAVFEVAAAVQVELAEEENDYEYEEAEEDVYEEEAVDGEEEYEEEVEDVVDAGKEISDREEVDSKAGVGDVGSENVIVADKDGSEKSEDRVKGESGESGNSDGSGNSKNDQEDGTGSVDGGLVGFNYEGRKNRGEDRTNYEDNTRDQKTYIESLYNKWFQSFDNQEPIGWSDPERDEEGGLNGRAYTNEYDRREREGWIGGGRASLERKRVENIDGNERAGAGRGNGVDSWRGRRYEERRSGNAGGYRRSGHDGRWYREGRRDDRRYSYNDDARDVDGWKRGRGRSREEHEDEPSGQQGRRRDRHAEEYQLSPTIVVQCLSEYNCIFSDELRWRDRALSLASKANEESGEGEVAKAEPIIVVQCLSENSCIFQ